MSLNSLTHKSKLYKKGVLLKGPSGVGKTLLVKKVASEAGVPLFVLNGAEVVSPFAGESEGRLRQVPSILLPPPPKTISLAYSLTGVCRGTHQSTMYCIY